MALKIRLKRMGQRNRPFYRLVVQDSAWRRDGKTVSDVGWYDSVKDPIEMSFKVKEICEWLEKGAKPSETVRSLLKKQGILDAFKSGEYKNLSDESKTVFGELSESAKTLAEKAAAPKEAPAVEAPVEEAAMAEPVAEEAPAAEVAPAEEPVAEEAKPDAQS